MKYGTFSAAIKVKVMLGPQAFGDWRDDNRATCALGAAAVAELGYEHEYGIDLGEFWPYGITARADCPESNCYICDLHIFGVVMHLNDDHKWTREAIADWVESEEEKLGFITLIESVESPELEEVTV